MKRPVFCLLFVLVFGWQEARGQCVPQPCKLVVFKTETCEFVTVDNRKQLKKFNARHRPSYKLTDNDFDSVSGLRLKVAKQLEKEVRCYEGADLIGERYPTILQDDPNLYFFKTNDKNACHEFIDKEVTKFHQPICCDTGPSDALCVVKEQLLDEVPGFIASGHKGIP